MNTYPDIEIANIISNFQPEKEVEVIRTPEKGKSYYVTVGVRKGCWPNEKYYSNEEMEFVGEYVDTYCTGGYHDNATYIAKFLLYGKEVIIKYNYQGTTCFFEHK